MTRRILLVAVLLVASASIAQAQMPDVSQMSGVPLPSGDLPTGTVSVRVVRGALGNDVVGTEVELHGGGQTWKALTDREGRAQFTQAAPGTSVHAVAVVDGQRLESQDFPVPSTGGMRVILVAPGQGGVGGGAPGASAPPPVAGTVTLGGQSRFVVEMSDEAVDVYYLFDLVNPAQAPASVDPSIAFEVPEGAVGLTVLEGSSPQASVAGRVVMVSGPFSPGLTPVRFAYQLPSASGSVTVSQRLPVALNQTALVVHKFGELQLTSPQLADSREVALEGKTYVMANGPGLAAGDTLSFTLEGLPYRSRLPRYIALALAVLIVGWGLRAGMGGPEPAAVDRAKLEGRREQLLNELVRLEEQRQAGKGDSSRHEERRHSLIQQLERVYADLDDLPEEAPTAHAGDVAAAAVR